MRAHSMMLTALLVTGALRAEPPPAAPVGAKPPQAQAPPASAPDDEFIEFLGEDDHGEGTWSEMVKKAQQQPGPSSPTAPSQRAKQS